MPGNRNARGQFVKGHSGNPSGRPAIPEAQKELLRNLVPNALEIKRRILMDEEAPLSLKNQVADSILDRVYGKPAQEQSGDGGNLDKLDALLRGITDEAQR